MNRATLCLGVLVWMTAGPVSAAPVRQETFGCRSLASAERLLALQKASDQDGYQDSLGRLVRAGECRVWAPGEDVAAEDEEEGFACFAPQASRRNCFWSAKTLTE